MFNAIHAADADGVLKDGEIQTIRAMAMVLGVPADEVDRLFDLHRDEKVFLTAQDGHPVPQRPPLGLSPAGSSDRARRRSSRAPAGLRRARPRGYRGTCSLTLICEPRSR